MKNFFIFFTTFLCIIIAVAAKACFWTDGYFINVANEMQNKEKVQVHCKSKDNDLGLRTIGFNESVHWQFCERIVTPSTLYFCHFFMGPFEQIFDVYNDSISHQCTEKRKQEHWRCTWLIKLDGFYFVNRKADQQREIKMYDWKLARWKLGKVPNHGGHA